MALIFVDGFDFWTTFPGCWTSNRNPAAGNELSRSGSLLHIPNGTPNFNGTWIRTTLPGAYSTIIVNTRLSFNANTTFADAPVLSFFNGNTSIGFIGFNSAGQLWFKRGTQSSNVQVGSNSTAAVTMDGTTQYDMEVKFVPSNSGSCEIRLNGEVVLNISGDTTDGFTTVDNILYGRTVDAWSISSQPGFNLEHVVIMDTTGTSMNDFIGPIKVNPHYLTADGFYTDFTANTGDRWDAVNDLDPDGSATYITANAVGNKYTAVADNLPAGITDVYALAVWAKSQRSDDVARAYKALLRYSGSDQLGSDDKYIGPNYAYQISTFDVSPFTDTTWTPTEIDGLEVGVQITV